MHIKITVHVVQCYCHGIPALSTFARLNTEDVVVYLGIKYLIVLVNSTFTTYNMLRLDVHVLAVYLSHSTHT